MRNKILLISAFMFLMVLLVNNAFAARKSVYIKEFGRGTGIQKNNGYPGIIKDYIKTRMTQRKKYTIVTKSEVREVFESWEKRMLYEDCNSEACMVDIAKRVNTDMILFGSIRFQDGAYYISGSLLDRSHSDSLTKSYIVGFKSVSPSIDRGKIVKISMLLADYFVDGDDDDLKDFLEEENDRDRESARKIEREMEEEREIAREEREESRIRRMMQNSSYNASFLSVTRSLGLFASYSKLSPDGTFGTLYGDLDGLSLSYFRPVHYLFSLGIGTSIYRGASEGEYNASVLLNNYTASLKFQVTILGFLNTYSGAGPVVSLIRESGDEESANFLAYGYCVYYGLSVHIQSRYNIYIEQRTITSEVDDQNSTPLEGTTISLGIYYITDIF